MSRTGINVDETACDMLARHNRIDPR